MMNDMDIRLRLGNLLKELKLSTIKKCYEEAALQAERESLSYERYLLYLLEKECEERLQKRIERSLRESHIPLEKSLNTFDLKRLPRKVASQVSHLIEGHFLARNENVLAFGNPGTGKSHLLCAIGQELIYKGQRVYFTKCSLLVQQLLSFKKELKLAQLFKRLERFRAIIIDELCKALHNSSYGKLNVMRS